MLPLLHHSITAFASLPAATPEQLEAVRSKFPNLPQEYFDLMQLATEIQLGLPDDGYLRIWSPEGPADYYEGYHFHQYMPGAIPIGDNGGCKAIFYADGNNDFGLYRVGFSNLVLEDATWISPGLEALLYRGEGLDLF
jgi:hypothetical protein